MFNVLTLCNVLLQVLCHYHGYVEGYEDSLVALSTCEGLRYELTAHIKRYIHFIMFTLQSV